MMLEGLYRSRDAWPGTVVSLQCAASLDDVAPFKTGVPTNIHWEASLVYYASTVTPQKLMEIAPESLANGAVVYASGPAKFVETTHEAWAAAGGAADCVVEYSFVNNRQFPLSATSKPALLLATSDGCVEDNKVGQSRSSLRAG
ncbi:Aste57867_16623 [Aphanomyces stellatus]|uniref:Aste57867_16623 protein n=1 Tax=Aphanomyces stellatus TaxID=120398 RepID=A0A485L5W2_9STRA|nr:hypothetical protein As57867_016566 [Aphanomyces stellatus]VFT93394.1 Aste57867_16623 [Aphanomyces stellatus]